MNLLLKALRTQLTDATLNAIVPVADITGSYNAESSNYPAMVLGIYTGGSREEVSGVTRATLVIDVYSKVNKLQLWTIYNLVKGLLHNQGASITDASRLVHVIQETAVDDNQYDSGSDAWHLTARYEILFSTTSVVGIATEGGAIYADASDVTDDSGKEIAKFRGMVWLDIAYIGEARSEQERFEKTIWYKSGIVLITIEEVMFKEASLGDLWGITANASDTLADDSTAATSYTITQATAPQFLQFLFQATKTSDGKKLEIEADNAVCQSMRIPFGGGDFAIYRCAWRCLGDASDNVVKVITEN